VHAEAEVHDTPDSPLDVAPLGVGVDWMVQVVPFQFSASVWLAPALVVEYPVAVQAEAEVQDTSDSALDVAPLGVGVDWRVQVVPFQVSASAWATPALVV
jgi:hypothetical protein